MRPAIIPTPSWATGLALRTLTLPPVEHTNCFILGHHDALIVDPGSSFSGELALLSAALHERLGSGGSLQAIFLTHHHGDHIGGVAALQKRFTLPVFAHAATLDRLPRELAANCRQLGESDPLSCTTSRRQSIALQVVHTPGHAPGHLCLFEPQTRCLLAGDMVPGIGTTLVCPPDGDMTQYLQSLRRLADLNPALLLPAHGPPQPNATAWIEQLITHRIKREKMVFDALSNYPQSLEQIAQRAYPEVTDYRIPLAQKSTLSHLLKLQDDARATATENAYWRRC